MQEPGIYLLSEEPFKYLLEKECKRAVRYSHYFSILLVKLELADVENPLISTIARLVQSEIRGSDIIGAFQGDNQAVLLVALLPHAEDQNILDLARRIRNSIRDYNPFPPHDHESQDIIIGGACFPTHACTAQDLISAAQERPLP